MITTLLLCIVTVERIGMKNGLLPTSELAQMTRPHCCAPCLGWGRGPAWGLAEGVRETICLAIGDSCKERWLALLGLLISPDLILIYTPPPFQKKSKVPQSPISGGLGTTSSLGCGGPGVPPVERRRRRGGLRSSNFVR
jgi:hypothetical protein